MCSLKCRMLAVMMHDTRCLFILRASPLLMDAMDWNWLRGDAEVEWLSMNLMWLSRYEMMQRLDVTHDWLWVFSGYMLGPQVLAAPSMSFEPLANNGPGLPPVMMQPGFVYSYVTVPLSANGGLMFDSECNKPFLSPHRPSGTHFLEADRAPYMCVFFI